SFYRAPVSATHPWQYTTWYPVPMHWSHLSYPVVRPACPSDFASCPHPRITPVSRTYHSSYCIRPILQLCPRPPPSLLPYRSCSHPIGVLVPNSSPYSREKRPHLPVSSYPRPQLSAIKWIYPIR